MNQLKNIALAVIMLLAAFTPQKAVACSGDAPFIATICVFAGSFAPRGTALAQGQLMAISSNEALFSLLGTTYGGDGRTTFGLPDLRGRVAIHQGSGPGLTTYRLGNKGGLERVFLTSSHLPSHTHSISHTTNVTIDNDALNDVNNLSASLKASDTAANTTIAGGNSLARIAGRRAAMYSSNTPDVVMAGEALSLEIDTSSSVNTTATTTVGFSGASLAHENRQPFITMNFIITLTGIYPSRS